MKMNDICSCLARVYRTLNRPLIRSKTDVECDVYSCDMTDRPTLTLNIKGVPEIKILDLVLIIAAIKAVCVLFGSFIRSFRN